MEQSVNAGKSKHGWQGLDLAAALRILAHAGRADPMKNGGEPTTQLQALIDALCDLSLHDGLTGLVNATFFRAALASEIDRSVRTGRACGLLLLDIDHFKQVNDTYGHQTGDLVLQRLGWQLKRSLRNMDTPARLGGEEFAVILPECDPLDAVCAAVRIHALLNPLNIQEDNEFLSITTSAGLVWTETRNIVTVEQFIAQADEQLYRAKQAGRSRLCHPTLVATQVSTQERAALSFSRHKEGHHER
jgi:diguanylate cyclase (GGDEF)-like protein